MAQDPRSARDYGFNGFFELRDPQALFKKMRYDYGRIASEPMNIYPVYDFFVTANHLIDWIWPSAGSAQHREERQLEALPRICEHLANGAKHFIVNRPHSAVARLEAIEAPKVDIDELVGDPEALGLAWLDPEDDLYVTLEPADAAELGVEMISAPDLARRVLIYWARRMGEGDISDKLPRVSSL